MAEPELCADAAPLDSGGLHSIEKRFLQKPHAKLTMPDGGRIEGEAAEDRLQALLGFRPAGKQGATAESLALWGALWVEQQDAARQFELPASGRARLHACIEAELGTVTGGERGEMLRAQAAARLSVLVDGFGKPKGRYRQVRDEFDASVAELGRLAGKAVELGASISELARLRRELARASDPAAAAGLAEDLADTRRRREAAVRHADRCAAAAAGLRLAEAGLSEAEAECGRRAARARGIEAALVRSSAADSEADAASSALRGAEDLLAARREGLAACELRSHEAGATLRAAQLAAGIAGRSGRADRLAGRLERAEAAQAAADALRGELEGMPASEARIMAVRAATAALEGARAALDAQATEVELELDPGQEGKVRVGGSGAPAGRSVLRLVEEATIHVAGVGRVRVRPAARDRDALLLKVAAAKARLDGALEAAGAATLEDAEGRGAARLVAEARLRSAEASLAAEAPGDPSEGLQPGVQALRDVVARLRGRVAAEAREAGLQAVPTPEAAEAALAAARATADLVDAGLAGARAAVAGPEAARDRASDAHALAAAEAGASREALAGLRREQRAAEGAEPGAELAVRLATAGGAAASARADASEVERQRPADTVEGMDARIRRLEEARAAGEVETGVLRDGIAGLAARVAQAEGEGLDELAALERRRRDDLAGEVAALQREAAALSLLRDVLADASREARERYVAPVVRRMTPYLGRLFPGVEVSCDEGLRVTGLARGGGAEELDRLSDGTREQVAVLLRLAYADLLVEQGRPAMVILDDALAYSDRDRLELVFDVLTEAAQRMQVLVFTCRGEAFGRLGGNRVRVVPDPS